MSPAEIHVQVQDDFQGHVSSEWLVRIASHALEQAPLGPGAAVSVVIADDRVVAELNRLHRGIDETTDVLAYSFSHEGEYYGRRDPTPEPLDHADFVLPPGEQTMLGEVIISYPQARRQADQSRVAVDKELAHLLTHGILHLLGHDHAEPEEEAEMRREEDRILTMVAGDAPPRSWT